MAKSAHHLRRLRSEPVAGKPKLDPEDHADLPWRIGEIAADFDLIDAWALPASGALEEFADLRQIFTDLDVGKDEGSRSSRFLFTARQWLGDRLGWDEEPNVLPIPGCDESTLRDRLPPDLVAETSDTVGQTPFRPVYLTADEWAIELSNKTVHAVLHFGWVAGYGEGYRGQLGIYVKPRGRVGSAYLAAIAPFRYWVVYPALLRRIDRAWRNRPATGRRPAPPPETAEPRNDGLRQR